MLIVRLSLYFNWLDLCGKKNSGNSKNDALNDALLFNA